MPSIDFKSLNRQPHLTVQQKSAYKKLFMAAEAAVTTKDSSLIEPKTIHLAMGGWFNGDEKHDIQTLFKEIRSAIDEDDKDRDITSILGSFRMGGTEKRIIKTMAQTAIAQISA